MIEFNGDKYVTKARLRRPSEVNEHQSIVYDGDTFRVKTNPMHGTYEYDIVRIYGVDTAELYGSDHNDAEMHRAFTQNWLSRVHDQFDREYPLILVEHTRDSFDRCVCEVYDRRTGETLNQNLLNEYNGIEFME